MISGGDDVSFPHIGIPIINLRWSSDSLRFIMGIAIPVRRPHWGRVTHICVGKLTIIGSDNVLSSGRRQAIIWTNAEILVIGPLGTNFSEILIAIEAFSFKKMHLKISSAKWRPFCLGLNVLRKQRPRTNRWHRITIQLRQEIIELLHSRKMSYILLRLFSQIAQKRHSGTKPPCMFIRHVLKTNHEIMNKIIFRNESVFETVPMLDLR